MRDIVKDNINTILVIGIPVFVFVVQKIILSYSSKSIPSLNTNNIAGNSIEQTSSIKQMKVRSGSAPDLTTVLADKVKIGDQNIENIVSKDNNVVRKELLTSGNSDQQSGDDEHDIWDGCDSDTEGRRFIVGKICELNGMYLKCELKRLNDFVNDMDADDDKKLEIFIAERSQIRHAYHDKTVEAILQNSRPNYSIV